MEVHENEPGNKVSMDQLFKGKKGVLFAVPGAFTPGCSKVTSIQIILNFNEFTWMCIPLFFLFVCSPCTFCMHHLKPLFHRKSFLSLIPQTHLPGFVEQAAELKSKGVQEVACISVNDAFVMAAWGKEHGAEGKVQNAV